MTKFFFIINFDAHAENNKKMIKKTNLKNYITYILFIIIKIMMYIRDIFKKKVFKSYKSVKNENKCDKINHLVIILIEKLSQQEFQNLYDYIKYYNVENLTFYNRDGNFII